MKYYVKVILENGLISQDIDVFSTMEEAKMFKNLSEKAGNKAEIYEIELIPAELEKLHEYKIVSKLSVEKLQEIRVEELKDFNSKILQAELKNQKLQKEIDAAKKYIEESYKADKEDNKLLDLIIEAVAKLKSDNETLKKALTEEIESIEKYLDKYGMSSYGANTRQAYLEGLKKALAAIGNEGSGDE